MLRKTLTLLSVAIILCSCSQPTPESLAKQACDCFKEAKNKNNPSNQINETQKCMNIVQQNLSVMDDIAKSNDWSQSKINEAHQRFDAVYDKCSN